MTRRDITGTYDVEAGPVRHKADTWKLSTDPQFTAKVRDAVGLTSARPGEE